ncbi:MAG: sulfite exporter TauE/SafE family protein [Cyanobacteria bacterium NC_groundwater_1444_Ag_S-0.65um_54_12]|nr:sulfite exporter TauE/SafE family protein [Cyanobacteria bacterium NC_groundwater_1444_Ag_S-0.65um_54_12]
MVLHSTYWFMLPISVLVATIAMLTGVGGAKFFTPLFLLALRLKPEVAFATALLTQSFGFLSGLFAYASHGKINYALGIRLLVVSIPTSLLASALGRYLPPVFLERTFALVLIILSITIHRDLKQRDSTIDPDRRLSWLGPVTAGLGGSFLGLISVGLGELLTPYFLIVKRYTYPKSIGTAVFIVFFTTLAAAAFHLFSVHSNQSAVAWQQVLDIVIFTIPGVLIGGQIAPWLTMRADAKRMKTFLRYSFVAIGLMMLVHGPA